MTDPGLAVDGPALTAFERGFTDPVPEARETAFAEKGIDRATMTVEQALERIAALDVAKASARLMTHRRTARKAYLELLKPHFG